MQLIGVSLWVTVNLFPENKEVPSPCGADACRKFVLRCGYAADWCFVLGYRKFISYSVSCNAERKTHPLKLEHKASVQIMKARKIFYP